jgi:hypothetical protein
VLAHTHPHRHFLFRQADEKAQRAQPRMHHLERLGEIGVVVCIGHGAAPALPNRCDGRHCLKIQRSTGQRARAVFEVSNQISPVQHTRTLTAGTFNPDQGLLRRSRVVSLAGFFQCRLGAYRHSGDLRKHGSMAMEDVPEYSIERSLVRAALVARAEAE